MKQSIFSRKMTRREFIKKAAIAAGGACLGLYTINKFFVKGNPSNFSLGFRNDAPKTLWKWSREADYYVRQGDSVQCKLCPHECRLGEGDRGFCRTRVNVKNKLYTVAYGNPNSMHTDPIEKKPLFHFLPTTQILSIATAGCNFRCLNCQNWQISQSRPEDTRNYDLMPASLVDSAVKEKTPSIAYTYSEPIAYYEYALDSAKIARSKGIKNVLVTAGFINEKPLLEWCKYFDACTLDVKGFDEDTYKRLNSGRLEPVLNSIKTLKQQGVWLEVSNLVVPGYTDDLDRIREMCRWLYRNVGPGTPLHFLRCTPMYKLTMIPATPAKVLEEARKIAMDEGMDFVYVGNVPNTDSQNTYCPKCGAVVIARQGYNVDISGLQNGACKKCGEEIAGVWEL